MLEQLGRADSCPHQAIGILLAARHVQNGRLPRAASLASQHGPGSPRRGHPRLAPRSCATAAAPPPDALILSLSTTQVLSYLACRIVVCTWQGVAFTRDLAEFEGEPGEWAAVPAAC